MRPARSDYGPQLQWEAPLWRWFSRLAQGYPAAVDRNAWLLTIEREAWEPNLAWDLLTAIEHAFSEAARRKAEESKRHD